ncbi:MAG: N-acetylmuramoyl-L-alanine amidase [Oscillospiraceae bacterium]|nr:N-acetylmuramoyl-L-alanine amidase [Oscillospiraceae bacterium]
MNSKKKYLLKFYIFVVMYIFMALFILYLTFKAIAATPALSNIYLMNVSANEDIIKSNKPVIIIDAGHGGIDGGASSSDGIIEKDINLAIALKLKRLFKTANCEVILTRETDVMLNDDGVKKRKASDLSNRVKIANKYPEAIFISIHMNKYPQEKYKGMQIFFSQNNLDSANLAELLKINYKSYIQPDNNREIKRGKDIFVLEKIKSIGILIECGFLSNHEEAHLLIQDNYQNKLAKIIFASVVEFEKKLVE